MMLWRRVERWEMSCFYNPNMNVIHESCSWIMNSFFHYLNLPQLFKLINYTEKASKEHLHCQMYICTQLFMIREFVREHETVHLWFVKLRYFSDDSSECLWLAIAFRRFIRVVIMNSNIQNIKLLMFKPVSGERWGRGLKCRGNQV